MTTQSKEEILYLANLVRIHCTEEEATSLEKDFAAILHHFQELQKIDTEGISPCHHVLRDACSVLREDEVDGELLDTQTFLSNAPDTIGQMIRVPPILQREG